MEMIDEKQNLFLFVNYHSGMFALRKCVFFNLFLHLCFEAKYTYGFFLIIYASISSILFK